LKIVCITGMHRSGTSVVARVVNLLGVYLGQEGEHIPASRNNPRGFWESKPIKDFNAQLLKQLGGSWHSPPILPDGWQQAGELDPLRKKAAALLNRVLGHVDVGGWKDPRTSLVLPFWRTVTPVEHTVLTLRHPQEVAASLVARNGFGPERSAQLWLRYVVAAWRADPACLLVDYEDFFTDCDATVDSLARGLGLAAPSSGTKDEVRAFFDPALRRHAERLRAGETMRLAEVVHGQLRSSEPSMLLPLADALQALWVQQDAGKRQDQALRAARRRADREQSELERLRALPAVRAALAFSRLTTAALEFVRRKSGKRAVAVGVSSASPRRLSG
jgi:hypothetical protein